MKRTTLLLLVGSLAALPGCRPSAAEPRPAAASSNADSAVESIALQRELLAELKRQTLLLEALRVQVTDSEDGIVTHILRLRRAAYEHAASENRIAAGSTGNEVFLESAKAFEESADSAQSVALTGEDASRANQKYLNRLLDAAHKGTSIEQLELIE